MKVISKASKCRGHRGCRLAVLIRLFNSFQATLRGDLDSLERRNLAPGQRQCAPLQGCEAICSNKSCQGRFATSRKLAPLRAVCDSDAEVFAASTASSRSAQARIDGDGVLI